MILPVCVLPAKTSRRGAVNKAADHKPEGHPLTQARDRLPKGSYNRTANNADVFHSTIYLITRMYVVHPSTDTSVYTTHTEKRKKRGPAAVVQLQ